MRCVTRVVLPLAVVLVLLCASALASEPTTDLLIPEERHQCGFEQLARKFDMRPQKVVLLEDDVANSTQVYGTVLRSSGGDYQSIRIGVFYEDLDDSSKYCTSAGGSAPDFQGGRATCTSDDILTSTKKSILKTKLIPDAVQLHIDRLKVKPLSSAIVVPSSNSGICAQFTVPSSHHTSGVSGYDFVIYVAAGPTGGNTIAWATTCATDSSTGRPLVGVTNISPKYIADDHNTVRVVAHELLHSLGFAQWAFEDAGIYKTTTIRQKSNVPVITAAKVVDAAKSHYGCSSLKNMEIEDGGGEGTAGSHWKRRNAKDELMAGISSYGYYTAMTIAAMESLGYYQGDYSKSEVMPWGSNVGCKLSTDMCMKKSKSLDTSMFCTGTPQYSCTAARDGMGYCQLENAYLPSWASNYGLFNDEDTMDYCPYVLGYSNTRCADGDAAMLPDSVFGSSSRCLDASSGRPVCAAITCGDSSYQVRFSSGSAMTCTPGEKVTISLSGRKVTCPPMHEVCDIQCTGDDCAPNSATMTTGWTTALLVALCAMVTMLM